MSDSNEYDSKEYNRKITDFCPLADLIIPLTISHIMAIKLWSRF